MMCQHEKHVKTIHRMHSLASVHVIQFVGERNKKKIHFTLSPTPRERERKEKKIQCTKIFFLRCFRSKLKSVNKISGLWADENSSLLLFWWKFVEIQSKQAHIHTHPMHYSWSWFSVYAFLIENRNHNNAHHSFSPLYSVHSVWYDDIPPKK